MLEDAQRRSQRPNIAPIPVEADAPNLKITGELPRELNGTLYRNGPNPQFEAPGAHWFVGDGMLHAFHLENGRARYRNRCVRTPKWAAGARSRPRLVRRLRPEIARYARPDYPGWRRRQHQHHFSWRPPAGA